MELISDYLAADLSADTSADALCIINIGCIFHKLFPCRVEKVSNGGCLEIQFSRILFVYFSLVAVWVIHSQMQVIRICGWHAFFIICIFFSSAAQMFNSATDWLFTKRWWLTLPLAQPAIACLFSNGRWQCLRPSQDWLPNLTLAANQETRISLSISNN